MNYNSTGAKPIASNKIILISALAFVLLIACMLFCSPVMAQEIKKADKELKDTVIRKITYKLYEGSRGGRYYLKTSANGSVYKVYIKAK